MKGFLWERTEGDGDTVWAEGVSGLPHQYCFNEANKQGRVEGKVRNNEFFR